MMYIKYIEFAVNTQTRLASRISHRRSSRGRRDAAV